MIVVIDNYDSFTYNLVQCFGAMGAEVHVFRNDTISCDALEGLAPSHIVISPGPGTPRQSGISNEVIRRFCDRTPILGVCLGHQCIGYVFGARVDRAPRLMHGKTSPIYHTAKGILSNLPNPFIATRYHSLILREPLPASLELTAFTLEGEVMAIQHREFPIFGVQFHPESILTQEGQRLLANFLRLSA